MIPDGQADGTAPAKCLFMQKESPIMKTNVKLVAGSLAGMLSVLGLVAGALVWAAQDDAQAARAEPAEAARLPIPALHRELTTAQTAPTGPAQLDDVRSDTQRLHPPEAGTPDPFEAELSRRGPVRVRRLVVSTGVRAHEPTGAADEFELGAQGRIYAFVDAVNRSGEDASLTVTFEPESGEVSGHVSLEVPANSPRYRTWAWTRHVYTTGRWQVVVRAADGRVVARRAFDVVR